MPTLSQATSIFKLNQKMLDKKLSKKEKGELRIKRLAEAEKNGELIHITDRQGIFKIIGLDSASNSTQQSWFRRAVSKGYITETPTKQVDKHGKPLMEYHIFPSKTISSKLAKNTNPIETITEAETSPQPVKTQEIKPDTTSVNIPIKPELLSQGFSLTLNINFNIGK